MNIKTELQTKNIVFSLFALRNKVAPINNLPIDIAISGFYKHNRINQW